MNKTLKNRKNKSIQETIKIYSDQQIVFFHQIGEKKPHKRKLPLKLMSRQKLNNEHGSSCHDYSWDIINQDFSYLINDDDNSNEYERTSTGLSDIPKMSINFGLDHKSNKIDYPTQKIENTILKEKIDMNNNTSDNEIVSPKLMTNKARQQPKTNNAIFRNTLMTPIKLSRQYRIRTASANPFETNSYNKTQSSQDDISKVENKSFIIPTINKKSISPNNETQHEKKNPKSELKRNVFTNENSNRVYIDNNIITNKEPIKPFNKLDIAIEQSKIRFSHKQLDEQNKKIEEETPKKFRKSSLNNISIGHQSNFQKKFRNGQRLENLNKSMYNNTTKGNSVMNSSMIFGNDLRMSDLTTDKKLQFEYNINKERILGRKFKPLNENGEKKL